MDVFFLPMYLAKLSGKMEERCYLDREFHLRQPSLSGESLAASVILRPSTNHKIHVFQPPNQIEQGKNKPKP